MAFSKIILNGTTLIDLTSDTVATDNLISPNTAHNNAGEAIVGSASGGGSITIDSLTVTPTTSQQVFNSSSVDGYKPVTVNAVSTMTLPIATDSTPTSGYSSVNTITKSTADQYLNIPIGYNSTNSYYKIAAVPNMTLPTSTESSATSGYTSKATISRSTSDQYINIPTGYNSTGSYYKINAVANGTEGTPTATKGTVSNHSISVTPSVTNSAGYISGGTKTGTAVTVSASELVSGTYSVTSSGTKDVTNYASASVPSGTATAPSTISGSSATVSTGTNTITLSKTVSVTPSISTAGYISSGTAGNSSVSLTASVTTKAATTYNTSSTDQTIASGTYLTGTQTIKAVTVSGLSAGNIADGVTVKVGDANDDDRIASVTGTLAFVTYRTGTTAPSSSLGNDNDIYLQTVS